MYQDVPVHKPKQHITWTVEAICGKKYMPKQLCLLYSVHYNILGITQQIFFAWHSKF